MDALNDTLRPIATANMASVVCISILYGAYLIVFPACVYVLVGQRAPGQPIHWVLLTAVCTQFVITTMIIVTVQTMVFQSYVNLADKPNALLRVVMYWSVGPPPLSKLWDVCSLINVAIGDAIMVWRVWILFHGRNSLICLPPIISLIGSTACGIVMVHEIWNNASQEFIRHLAVSAWTSGMVTQAYSTSFIAWEVWRRGILNTSSSASRSQTSYYKAIMSMIVESGAIYTALVLPLTIVFAVGSSSAIILAGLLEPMSGLIPASMIIRVGMNRNRQFQTSVLSQVHTPAINAINQEKGTETSDATVGITFTKSRHSADNADV